MSELLQRLVQRVGLLTPTVLALLAIALGSLYTGMLNASEGLDGGLLLLALAGGILAGWLMGRSRLAAWISLLLGLLLGLALIWLYLAGVAGPLLELVINSIIWLQAAIYIPAKGQAYIFPDTRPILLPIAYIWAHLNLVAVHLFYKIRDLLSGLPGSDAMAASALWALVLWGTAVFAAWVLRRRGQALLAVSPALLVLAGILNFARTNPFVLVPLLGAMFLLIFIYAHKQREERWVAQGLDYALELRLDMAVIAVPILAVILAAAALMPSVTYRQVADMARKLAQGPNEQMQKAGQSLGLKMAPPTPQPPSTEASFGSLPTSHLLGAGPELSHQVVMTIRVQDAAPEAAPVPGQANPGYRWRALTYDIYTGHGWLSSPVNIVNYRAGEPAIAVPEGTVSHPLQRVVVAQIFGAGSLGGVLYTPGPLVSADHDYSISWRAPRQEAEDQFAASINQNTYQAKAVLQLAGQAELRRAGEDYPEWVTKRYLQLPPKLPQRVIDLARQLTISDSNPYDEAVSIQDYLRTYSYTLNISTPPKDRDVADYFLFDLKKGYCDYYATSMVVMARSSGIPARLVIGYASGTFDDKRGQYIITGADAHSWPELYFPGIGWVEFEPTAGRPAILRPLTAPGEKQAADPVMKLPLSAWLYHGSRPYVLAAAGIFLAILLAFLAWQQVDMLLLRLGAPGYAVGRLFGRLRRSGERLMDAPHPGDTPYEFLLGLRQKLTRLRRMRLLSSLLAPISAEAERLSNLYAQAAYSSHPVTPVERERAMQGWRSIRWRLWVASLISRRVKDEG